jgi:hypothetical protein
MFEPDQMIALNLPDDGHPLGRRTEAWRRAI